MKVICVVKDNHKTCRNSSRAVPTPTVGSIYSVIEIRKFFGSHFYILEEMPHDVGYEYYLFSILSSIDETEMIREYKKELV